MSRRTSVRLASKSGSQKRPLEPDDKPINDETPDVDNAELGNEYVPRGNSKRPKKHNSQSEKIKIVRKFDASLLPNELLHSIFQYCDPKTLGKLMRVCKRFEYVLRMDYSVIPSFLGRSEPRFGEKSESAVTLVFLSTKMTLAWLTSFQIALQTLSPWACLKKKSCLLWVYYS